MNEEQLKEFLDTQQKLHGTVVKEEIKKKEDSSGHAYSYLSWSDAWNIVLKIAPTATYEILTFGEEKLPYQKSELGYMVWTKVTINGVSKVMWLPVMDSHNEAMLDKPRVVKTKYREFTVAPADMQDINKAIMRCLVKNLAMFGLGLNIYSGEDLPDIEEERIVVPTPPKEPERCEKCGKPIVNVGKFSAEKIVSTSLAKFGRKLCYNCATAPIDNKPQGE
jgi:hypothetical protein